MKTRESGMPDEKMWRSFFDAEAILTAMALDGTVCDAADFASGYGIFAIPAARRVQGTLHGFDIVPPFARKLLGGHQGNSRCRLRSACIGYTQDQDLTAARSGPCVATGSGVRRSGVQCARVDAAGAP